VPSRRALYAATPLATGTVIEASMLTALRPGDGVPANALPQLVGARLRCAVPAGSPLRFADVETRQERRSA
jgi:sialic acid synthase SpsE